MDLRQLTYFRAVATLGGFRRAAEELRIAQPAISEQIRRLEAELGTTLFDRSTRPVALTPAGERLLTHANRLLSEAAAVLEDMRGFATERSTLRVGTLQYLTLLDIPEVLSRFGAAHAGIELNVTVGNTGELEALLLRGDLDVVIVHTEGGVPGDRLTGEPWRREEVAVAVSLEHPLSGREDVAVQELADARFVTSRVGGLIRETFRARARAVGFDPEVAFEASDVATTLSLVGRDLGVAIVPRSVQALHADNVVVLPLRSTTALDVCLLRDAHRTPTPAIEAFMGFMAKTGSNAPSSGAR
ncbi:LysR family transcriptional regulator [Baekduia soli]|uniref:LysR family transcriptional regulator n=1 Tax=Baekduia soli TaxID=496014 RepID=A0A5B8U157_9ACTN|nr:LysR family transcriptional regulator [Baekduia soli]QEC46753.1 LysR family transcriptional regulator [Baekduia soli]